MGDNVPLETINRRQNNDQIFRQSVDASQSGSRATFPTIQLGVRGGGQRVNIQLQQQQQQQQEQQQKVKLDSINYESLNRILYGLLQQKELVKYILDSDKIQQTDAIWTLHSPDQISQKLGQLQWQQAGQRLIDTISKSRDLSQAHNRTQIHSLEIQSVKEIYIMLNNFAVLYIQIKQPQNGNILLQCAIKMYQFYPEIKNSAQLTALMYSNLSLFHLNDKDDRSSKYMDGAIISNKREIDSSYYQLIALAISLNNKAVIELKRNNFEASREFSLKTVEMVEQRVFGMINSDLVTKVNQTRQPNNQNQLMFQEMLQVLLIAYYNLAMSRDRHYSSREIYLQGMQLCYQYLPGGRQNFLFQKFEVKYSRKMYNFLTPENQIMDTFEQLDPNSALPEILPLDESQHDNTSNVSPNFQQNLTRINIMRQAPAQAANEDRSFTIMDSDRSKITNNNGPPVVLFREESVVSMPCKRNGLSNTGRKDPFQKNRTNTLTSAKLQSQAQRSEIVQNYTNLSGGNLNIKIRDKINIEEPKMSPGNRYDDGRLPELRDSGQGSILALPKDEKIHLRISNVMSSEIDHKGKKLEVVDESMNESRNLSLNMRDTMTKNPSSITKQTGKTFAEDLPEKIAQKQPMTIASEIQKRKEVLESPDPFKKNESVSISSPITFQKTQEQLDLEKKKNQELIDQQVAAQVAAQMKQLKEREEMMQKMFQDQFKVMQEQMDSLKKAKEQTQTQEVENCFKKQPVSHFAKPEANTVKKFERSQTISIDKPIMNDKLPAYSQEVKKLEQQINELNKKHFQDDPMIDSDEKPSALNIYSEIAPPADLNDDHTQNTLSDNRPASLQQKVGIKVQKILPKKDQKEDTLKIQPRFRSGQSDNSSKSMPREGLTPNFNIKGNKMDEFPMLNFAADQFQPNLHQFIEDFTSLNDDQFLEQMQKLQNLDQFALEKQYMLDIRQHFMLYRPQGMWRFNQALIKEIKQKKKIICSKMVQQIHNMKVFKVSIEVNMLRDDGNKVDYSKMSQQQIQNLLENQIQITFSADPQQDGEKVSVNQDSVSLLLLQTLLYQFNGFEIIDPCSVVGNQGYALMGSMPFFNIESFQDLCQHVIFHFIEIDSGIQHNSIGGPRVSISSKNSFKKEGTNVEFQDNPQGLFVDSLPISFLYESNDSIQMVNQKNNKFNCEFNIHHISKNIFKMVMIPIYDNQTIQFQQLLSKINPNCLSPQDSKILTEINQNTDLLINLEPKNAQVLSIDMELQKPSMYFEELKTVRPVDQECLFKSYKLIDKQQEFYEKHFKMYIKALEELLKKEYQEWFDSISSTNNQQKNCGILNQSFLKLIVFCKVAHIQLKIGDDKKSEMFVFLRTNQDSIKVVCLYSNASTQGKIVESGTNYETSVKTLSNIFGQDLELQFTLQNHYILSQLCKLLMLVVNLQFISEVKSESENSMLSNSSEDESSDSDGSGSKGSKGGEDAIATVVAKYIISNCYKRHIIMQDGQPIAVTCNVIVSVEAQKIFGIRIVVMNQEIVHESGVFFLMDQTKWKKKDSESFAITQKYIHQVMKDQGFDYLMDECIDIVPANSGGYQVKIKEQKLAIIGQKQPLYAKECTITQLERYFTPDQVKI